VAGLWGKSAHLAGVNNLTNVWGLDPMMSVTDLAKYLGVPVATVYDWRSNGTGPVGHRFGKHVKFSVPDVRLWVESQRDAVPSSARGDLR